MILYREPNALRVLSPKFFGDFPLAELMGSVHSTDGISKVLMVSLHSTENPPHYWIVSLHSPNHPM